MPRRGCEQPAGHVDLGSVWQLALPGGAGLALDWELQLHLPRYKEQHAERQNCYCGFYWTACPNRALVTLASGEVTFCWPRPLATSSVGTAVPGQATLPSCCFPAQKRGRSPAPEAIANDRSFLAIPVAVDDFSVLKLVCVLTCPLQYPYRYICCVPYEMLGSGKSTHRRPVVSPPLNDRTLCRPGGRCVQRSQQSSKRSRSVEDDKEGHLVCRIGDWLQERCTATFRKTLPLLLPPG